MLQQYSSYNLHTMKEKKERVNSINEQKLEGITTRMTNLELGPTIVTA